MRASVRNRPEADESHAAGVSEETFTHGCDSSHAGLALVAWCLLLAIIGAGSAKAQARWALVVGTGHYATLPALPSAENDARAMADSLGRAGFRVTLLIDPTIAALRQAVAVAETAAAGAPAAVFYYAGHAVQFGPN